MGLLRYQIFLTYGVTFLSVWYYGLQHVDEWSALSSSSSSSPALLHLAITYAPVWAVLVLAVFLLTRLILGVLAYQDCPEAATEIEQQIRQARVELKKRKIISDSS